MLLMDMTSFASRKLDATLRAFNGSRRYVDIAEALSVEIPPIVLLAEDDDDMASLIDRVLQKAGLQVVRARDGWHMIKLMRETPRPDLVILDINLPYFDGHHLIHFVRTHPGWDGVPVLMLTADNSRRAIARAFSLGANDYFLKPFVPSALADRVKRLAGLPVEEGEEGPVASGF